MQKRLTDLAAAIIRRIFTNENRSFVTLAFGASLGVILAVLVLIGEERSPAFDSAVIAVVDGVPIEVDDYVRAVDLFAAEKRSAITGVDRLLILERMIEEELLLQYGIEVGLVRQSQAVRSEVLRSVVQSLTMELEARVIVDDSRPGKKQANEDYLVKYLGFLRNRAIIRGAASEVGQ